MTCPITFATTLKIRIKSIVVHNCEHTLMGSMNYYEYCAMFSFNLPLLPCYVNIILYSRKLLSENEFRVVIETQNINPQIISLVIKLTCF